MYFRVLCSEYLSLVGIPNDFDLFVQSKYDYNYSQAIFFMVFSSSLMIHHANIEILVHYIHFHFCCLYI